MATGPTKHLKKAPNPTSNSQPKALTPSERFETVAPPSSSPSSSSDDSSRSRSPPPRDDGQPAASAGYVKIDDKKVRISLGSVQSGSQVRELKRKLVNELEQVRNLRNRIEARGGQCVNGYNGNNGGEDEGNNGNGENGVGSGVGGGNRFGTLARVNSEVSCVGPAIAQTVQGLTVSALDREKKILKGNNLSRKDSGPVSGKEKLLNSGGVKRAKPSGGKKDGSRQVPGFGSGMDQYPKGLFKSCGDLLAKLMKHQYGWVFNAPVDVKKLKLHDYHAIIKHPMDLGTVKTRLSKNWYKSPKEFAEDVRLTFNNAMTYNAKGQDVHIMADVLLKIFEEQWTEVKQEYNCAERFEMRHDDSLPTAASRKTPAAPTRAHAHHPPLATPLEKQILGQSESMANSKDFRSKATNNPSNPGKKKLPKNPKEKDPIKKPMTYEEKQRLSTSIENLPSHKLDIVVQIIRKRNPGLFQQEDEIEVDIDSFDSETLWELESFVKNYMNGLTESERKAQVAFQATEAVSHNIQESYPASTTGNALKVPGAEKEAYCASGSNGSNSSSGVSGCSSRGSDRDSSTDGSDVGQ